MENSRKRGRIKGIEKSGGREAGTPNKTTVEIKQAFKELVEGNLDKISAWMERVAVKEPDKALEFMFKFAQFTVPLLNRTTIDGDASKTTINVTIKKKDDKA